ncbi:MAG: hypothetical protein IKP47_00645 [Ruminococcus sp.]|nr:hypothetical protein [Ruminococcus sp.]
MKKKTKMRLAGAGCAVLAAGLIFVILFFALSGGSIVGTWTIDGVTTYRFDEGGEGAMILPLDSYEFRYTIEDDKITIDFKDDALIDKDYTYKKFWSTLTLKEGSEVEHKMTKQS